MNIQITERERNILEVLKTGLTQQQAARKLAISQRALEHSLYDLRTRLNCHNTIELVALVYENGLMGNKNAGILADNGEGQE